MLTSYLLFCLSFSILFATWMMMFNFCPQILLWDVTKLAESYLKSAKILFKVYKGCNASINPIPLLRMPRKRLRMVSPTSTPLLTLASLSCAKSLWSLLSNRHITFSLWAPHSFQALMMCVTKDWKACEIHTQNVVFLLKKKEGARIKPTTSRMRSERSTNWAKPPT